MPRPLNNSPLEDDEQIEFVSWCEDRGLKLTAVPNNTYTPHHSVKARNHRLGLRPGFPDLVVLIQPHQSKDGEGYFLAIEMKRQRGGTLSDTQRAWQEAITGLGCLNVQAYVCKGAQEAQTVVGHYLNDDVEITAF